MNALNEKFTKGTFGELLVQLRLLQYGVQAAPPFKDSGNDLIAIRGEEFRAIQVKTRAPGGGVRINKKKLPKLYHIMAIVLLDPNGEGTNLSLDMCWVYLLTKEEFEEGFPDLAPFRINQERVDALFPLPHSAASEAGGLL